MLQLPAPALGANPNAALAMLLRPCINSSVLLLGRVLVRLASDTEFMSETIELTTAISRADGTSSTASGMKLRSQQPGRDVADGPPHGRFAQQRARQVVRQRAEYQTRQDGRDELDEPERHADEQQGEHTDQQTVGLECIPPRAGPVGPHYRRGHPEQGVQLPEKHQ